MIIEKKTRKNRRKKGLIGGVVLLVILLGLGGCGQESSDGSNENGIDSAHSLVDTKETIAEDKTEIFELNEEEDALAETLQADLVAQDLKEKYMYDVNLIVSEDMCIDSDSFEDFKISVSESDEETKATFVKNASATTDAEAMQYNVLSELDKRAKEILAEIITDEMSDLQKVKAIHDYMVVNFDYDYDNYLMKTIPYYSYTPQGAFENGYIVCAGYAKTFALFCKHADIRCEYVVGLGGEGLHAWNQVEIDGEWYNIDVTWDDPTWLGKEFDNHISNNYNYFLLCDEHMYENHTAYNAKNICTALCYGRNAFSIEGSNSDVYGGADYVDSNEKIYEIVRDALENGKNKFKITVSGNFEGEVRKAVKEGCVIAGYPLDTFSCNSTSHLDGGIVEYWFKVSKEPVEKVVTFYNEQDVRDYYDQCIADGFYGEEAVYYRDTSIDMERIVWDYLLNGAIVGYHIGDEVAPGYYRGTAHVWERGFDVYTSLDDISVGIQKAYEEGLAEYSVLYDFRGRELTSNEARDEILNVYLGKINSHGHSIGGYWEEGLLLFNVIFRKE